MRNVEFGLACAACVLSGLGILEATSRQQGRGSTPPLNPSICLDAAGSSYSKNAMVKVNGPIQACDGGNRWIASSTDGTRDEKTAAAAQGKKDCIGKHQEAYESGLYRQVEKHFERCGNGKWVPERK